MTSIDYNNIIYTIKSTNFTAYVAGIVASTTDNIITIPVSITYSGTV
jgi:hypothetical protein